MRFQEQETNFFEQLFNPINILNSLFMPMMQPMPMMMMMPMQMQPMITISVIEMSSLRNQNNQMFMQNNQQISRVNNLANSPFFSLSTL